MAAHHGHGRGAGHRVAVSLDGVACRDVGRIGRLILCEDFVFHGIENTVKRIRDYSHTVHVWQSVLSNKQQTVFRSVKEQVLRISLISHFSPCAAAATGPRGEATTHLPARSAAGSE